MKLKLITALLLTSAVAGAEGIDSCIDGYLSRNGITLSGPCDPARLVRRYHLVLTDRIPTEAETKAFLSNPDRERLVDSLLASDGFVRKQVLKWGDLLRVKSEFPSCMWPNAVQAFNKWMTGEFRNNTPYNEFVAKLLDCTGSNFRVPQTNFYRSGSDRRPSKFTSDIALIFLGRREAPEEWQNFFCQVKFKGTKEWKEEILCIDPDILPSEVSVKLGGKTVSLDEGTDFRKPFISWLTSPSNRELARVYVNRFWYWMMGEGIISPVDDVEGREPSNPALLDYLTDRFVSSGFNVRALAREILLSEAFCRSSLSEGNNAGDRKYYSHFIQTRLTSEQICDALCDITEVYDRYSSRAPEPFTNFPVGTHANEVCDGTITTTQLDIFGRHSRDVALESARDNSVNAKQILYLLNSTDIQEKLHRSPVISSVVRSGDVRSVTSFLYFRILSRPASEAETAAVAAWKEATGSSLRQTAESLAWALVNTDEFLFLN